jgi:hypothetical protein
MKMKIQKKVISEIYIKTKRIFILLETHLTSLYVDEQSLTRDQVILPRDFLNFNLQRHIKQSGECLKFIHRLKFSF